MERHANEQYRRRKGMQHRSNASSSQAHQDDNPTSREAPIVETPLNPAISVTIRKDALDKSCLQPLGTESISKSAQDSR